MEKFSNNNRQAEEDRIRGIIKQTLTIALSDHYYHTARRHLEHGFKSVPLGSRDSGRLYRTEGVLDIIEAQYNDGVETESLFAHAALSLMKGDCFIGESTTQIKEMTSESLRRGGFPYLATLYNYANETSSCSFPYQFSRFPEIRKTLLK